MVRILLCFVILALVGAAPARAAEDPKIEEIKAHAAKAKVHYDLGEYQQAAEEYIIVYRLKALPAVLYNIAQSYRQAGQYEKAKQFYKSYLRETPDPKNRPVIEKAMREIDELLAKEKKAKDVPPTGVAHEPSTVTPPPAKATPAQPPATTPALATAQPEAAPAKPTAVPATAVPAQQLSSTQQPAAQAAVVKEPAKPSMSKDLAKPTGTQLAVATPRTAPAASTSTSSTPAIAEGTPFYKTWWFWTAAGVVAVGAGTAVALSAHGGGSPPATHFGNTPVF